MLFKNAIKTIGKTKGRFFSILAIVAVGVAFFSGVLASAPNMKYNADLYFDEYNLMDYQIMSNFGLTDEDIQSLEKIDGKQTRRSRRRRHFCRRFDVDGHSAFENGKRGEQKTA